MALTLLYLMLGAYSYGALAATHTRDMYRMGGLIKRMPWTALFFLIGSVAIAGIPPLNGFVGEWLLFQALLPGVSLSQPVAAALVTLALGMLALTSGLVAAGFVKAFGISFLAVPRSPAAEHAHEALRSMQLGMGVLVLACLALGLAPTAVVSLLVRVIAGLGALPTIPPVFGAGLSLSIPASFAEISPTLAALGLLVVLGLVSVGMAVLRVNHQWRVGDAWGCGCIGQMPRMEYTATAFAELYRPTKELTIDFHPESKYFVQSIAYRSQIRPSFEEFVYDPVLSATQWVSRYLRRVQSGSLHGYVAYLSVVLVLLLGALLWPGS